MRTAAAALVTDRNVVVVVARVSVVFAGLQVAASL